MSTSFLEITTDKKRIDVDFVFEYLNGTSYWAKGIPRDVLEKSIEHSLCFSVCAENQQVGFARVITDFATFAYLCDVFIDPKHRGKAYSKELMKYILAHPDLQIIRFWSLMTGDAHGLYQQFGFTAPSNPEKVMERLKKNPYG